MRSARIKVEGDAYYHCISRVIDRRFVLKKTEKEKFREIMRKVEHFTGIQVLTYAVLGNHWHILLSVPEKRDISDAELIDRLRSLYAPHQVDQVALQLAQLRADRQHVAAEALKSRYTYRMYDMSEFFKCLKQRFTQWYNLRNDRRGTLWEQRFKSILVEDSAHALSVVAAYVDLNPVRAGLAQTPESYRYCGYGEAIAGDIRARAGIQKIMQLTGSTASWRRVRCWYRKHLYLQGETKGVDSEGLPMRPGFSTEEVEKVIQAGGELPMHSVLNCRVRYFSDGLVLGNKEFVEDIFDKYRDQFGKRRTSGSRAMKYGRWGGLCTLRDLRISPVSIPHAKARSSS